jgi:hypothetical protein
MAAQVDLYCERLGSSLWAEPLNSPTNLAFRLVAVIVWRMARLRRREAVLTAGAIGMVLTFIAAYLQQHEISLGALYLSHNAFYPFAPGSGFGVHSSRRARPRPIDEQLNSSACRHAVSS